MTVSCGIDLGTTNSCVALAAPRLPKVVRDRHGRLTLPSVVFRDSAGATSVGNKARNRIGEVPGPVDNVKRLMGSETRVRLGGEEATPVQVSALILSELKRMAEAEAGEVIEDAVITVPAYFTFKQKQDTEVAAQQSGFRRVLILQEPVAAALAYCLDHAEGPLTVLAYDLGGGTFDATVLERTADNELNVLAFGGDAFLGGDNFDALLAEELRRRLAARGYAVEWNLKDRADHKAKFQKLKFLAEEAKKRLSFDPETMVAAPAVFADENGVEINLEEPVTRDQLMELIGGLIERSIQLTRETFERSKLGLARLDRLIMVGGSSYIPIIRTRLAETFGREPELVDPDTIIAVGAAIKAALSFGRRFKGRDIELELECPELTAAPTARIAGRLSRPVEGWTLSVFVGEGETVQPLKGDRFLLDALTLEAGAVTEIVLVLEDDAGAERLSVELQVRHQADGATLHVPDALIAKPFSVRTVGGIEEVLPAGTKLPINVRRTFVTEDQSGTVRVPIFEGHAQIGEVVLGAVPTTLAVGSPVEVELVLNRDYSVSATARIASTGHQTQARFDLPRVDDIDAPAARERLAKREARWKRALESGGKGDAATYERLRDEVLAEAALPQPQGGRIAESLSGIDQVLLAVENDLIALDGLRPALSELEQALDETLARAREKRGSLRGGLSLERLEERVGETRRALHDAWQRRDATAWREAKSRLSVLREIASPDLDDLPKDEARELTVQCVIWLEQVKQDSPTARSMLSGVNLRALAVLALDNPHESFRACLALLRKLGEAGVIDFGAPKPQAAGAGRPAMPEHLRGLLRGRG